MVPCPNISDMKTPIGCESNDRFDEDVDVREMMRVRIPGGLRLAKKQKLKLFTIYSNKL